MSPLLLCATWIETLFTKLSIVIIGLTLTEQLARDDPSCGLPSNLFVDWCVIGDEVQVIR